MRSTLSLMLSGEFYLICKRYKKEKNKEKVFHDAVLQDLHLPSKIVGKPICVNQESSWNLKTHLDKARQNNVEAKARTFFLDVYKKLTGKLVNF